MTSGFAISYTNYGHLSSEVLAIFLEVFQGPYMEQQYAEISNEPVYAVTEHVYGDVCDIKEQLDDIKRKAKHCYPYSFREVSEFCYELRIGYYTPIVQQEIVKKSDIFLTGTVNLSYIRMDDDSVCCHISDHDDAEISCFDNPLEHYIRLSKRDAIAWDDVKDFKQPY